MQCLVITTVSVSHLLEITVVKFLTSEKILTNKYLIRWIGPAYNHIGVM